MGMLRRGMTVAMLVVVGAVGAAPAEADQGGSRDYAFQAGSLDTGGMSTCAVVGDHKVRCWGFNDSGSLGNDLGTSIGQFPGEMAAMSDIALPAGATAVASGAAHSCALFRAGTVRCWGRGSEGQLGNTDHPTDSIGGTGQHMGQARDVPLPAPARAVAAGDFHSCALLSTGRVRCWGLGSSGQLGTDATDNVGDAYGWQDTVTDVPLPAQATAIAAGGRTTCAILVTGKVRCWGDGSSGQLGVDSTANIGDSADSMEGAGDVRLPASAVAVSVGDSSACAILVTGKLRCWGSGDGGRLGTNGTGSIGATPNSMENASDVPLPANVAAVSVGAFHACAVLVTKKVRCWGSGDGGRLGNDDTGNIGDTAGSMQAASDVALPSGAVAVAAGVYHSCAVLATGKVRCWGAGLSGLLGNDASTGIGDTAGSMAAASDVTLPTIATTGADLALDASASPATQVQSGPVVVTLTVRNDGSDTATGVTVPAPPPTGTTLSSSTKSAGTTYAGGVWTIPSLAPGASVTLTLSVTMPTGYIKPAAAYEIGASAPADPDSIPGNAADGEDDRATVSLETKLGPPNENAPDKEALYQYDTKFGSTGSGDGQLSQPWDVAVDQATDTSLTIVHVSDHGNDRVQQFINGVYVSKVGTTGPGVGELRGPQGIAYRKHRLYVVDAGAYLSPRVQVYATGAIGNAPTYDSTFATDGSIDYPGSTNSPSDVDANGFNGHLYVTDRPFKPVQEFDGGENFLRQFGGGFSGADGVAVNEKSGKVYVVDSGNDRVQVYDADGAPVTSFGSSGTGDGQFSTPSGITIDPVGRRVFVVDGGNGRVEVFDLQGHYLTQFGSPGSGNGQLSSPRGIAFDGRHGKVLVADTGNDRIVQFNQQFLAPPPPPPPVDPPPSACAAGSTMQDIVMGLAKVHGCLSSKQSNGTYVAKTGITLNGVPLGTFGKWLIIDPSKTAPTIKVQDEGAAQLSIAGIPVSKDSALRLIKIPTTDKEIDEKNLFPALGATGSIYGLKLKGSLALSLGRAPGGRYYASFTLTVGLPEVLKGADGKGGLESKVAVRVDETGAVNSNGVNFTVTDAKLGPLVVKTACFALLPTSASTVGECAQPTPWSFRKEPVNVAQTDAYLACKPDTTPGPHWSTAIAIQLPTPSETQIGVYGSGNGPDLHSLGGFGQNLGIPIADGVTLETLGAGVCLPTAATPELAIKGTVGVGVIPLGTRPLITIDGSLTYRGLIKAPYTWSLGFEGNVFVRDFGQLGNGGIDVASNGTFGAHVSVSSRVAGFLVLTGKVAGAYSPKTKAYNVSGGVDLCPVGDDAHRFCIGANALVSNIGIAGCVTATSWFGAGFGYKWGDQGVTILGSTCDFGPWTAKVTRRAAGAGAPLTFDVAPGTKAVGFRAFGATAPPGLRVTGPGGTKIVLPAAVPLQRTSDRFVMQNPKDKSTNVALGNLKPGTYTITALDPKNPITRVDTARAYAHFSGRGKVTSASGGRRQVALRYVLPTGAKAGLVETATAGGKLVAQQTISKELRGRPCPGARKRIAGGTELCATVSFTPTRGPGGTRRLAAVVSRGGQPIANVTVATFTVAKPKAPGRPARVQLTRRGTTVTVRWSPAAGADRFGLVAKPTSSVTRSRFLAGTCAGLTLTGVSRTDGVTVSIAGIRYDGITGKTAAATLKAGKAKGGSRGRALKGRLCR